MGTGAGGTGWMAHRDGGAPVILTNAHVCGDQEEVVITNEYRGFTSFPLKVLLKDDGADICAVSAPEGYPSLYIADREAEPSDTVRVLGHPRLRALSWSKGFVLWTTAEEIGMTNRVVPGNSGSPLLNSRGDVVGMIMAYETATLHGIAIQASRIAQFLVALAIAEATGESTEHSSSDSP